MKTKLLQIMLIVVAGLIVSSASAETFYVAPGGSDGGDGTIGDPWETLNGARLNVQPYLDGNGDITVYFRGGTYTLTNTVVFDTSDDGTANQSVNYAAYPGETPIFSSLVQVTGWSTYSGSIMQANLPGGISSVRYLHDTSENWMPRSATSYFTPDESTSEGNEGPMYDPPGQAGKQTVKYPTSWSTPNWTYASQYDLRVSTEAWTVNVIPISSVNSSTRYIDVATPATYQMKNCTGDCAPSEAWVLNSIDGIDSAGEWACLNGKIYLYPASGTGDIYVPAITEFVRVDEGTADGNTDISTPVQYINFSGITFTGGDFYMRYYDYNNPLNSDVTSQHDWGIVDRPAGMLEFRNAANCTVDGCTFTRSGGGGVRLDRYAQNITVTNCDFNYLGREAVSLMGRGIGYGDVSKNNEVSYNDMIATGREKWDAPAINLSQSSNNWIHHNFIDDTHMSAIIFTSSRGVYLAYKCYEDSDSYFVGAECHYWECHPTAVATSCDEATYGYEEAKIESHKYMYNYNNNIEKNVITDAHNGGQFFHNTVSLTNGIIYTSGGKFNETNYLQLNYFYDCDPAPNTQLLYADTYMDHMHANKNMMHNVQIGNGSTEAYILFDVFCNWQDWNVQHGNQQGYVNANVEQNSSYGGYTYGMYINTDGNIDLDDNNPNGSSSFVNDYEEIYSTLCPGQLPGPDPLPGASAMQTDLASKITAFGGTVPDCAPDTDPPTPDPMTWASVPAAGGQDNISMTATTATDDSGVEYNFDETSGNPGGSDSGWQDSASYTDTGLNASTQYCYEVTARDKSVNQNATAASNNQCATTDAPDTTPPTPDPMTWAAAPSANDHQSISMTATTASDPSGVQYYFDETTGGPGSTDSGWQSSAGYTDSGLSPETQYTYTVTARDVSPNYNETAASTDESATTQAAPTEVTIIGSWTTGLSHTAESGSNRVLIFTAHAQDNQSAGSYLNSVTYGGKSMTEIQEEEYYVDPYHYIVSAWVLDEAGIDGASGSNFVVSWSDGGPSNTPGYSSVFLENVDQTTPIGASAANNCDCEILSTSALATNNGDMVMLTATHGGNSASSTDYECLNGFTEALEFYNPPNSGEGMGGYKAATGANETPSVDSQNNNYSGRQALIGFVVQAGAAAPPDTTPPTPDPMTWATTPYSTGETSITMVATTASDPSGVEYNFDETSGNPGGSDSGWQDSTSYTDSGLNASTQYCYQVQARDKSVNQNATAVSSNQCATTDTPDTTPPTPNPATWASVPSADSSSAISMTATTGSDPSGVQYSFDETTGGPGGTDSGWQTSANYTDSGLTESTQYTYRVQMRDQSANQNTSSWSTSESATTQAGGGTWTKVDDADPGWTYTGTWSQWAEPVAYMGTVTGLEGTGEGSYTFTGTKVRFYATIHNFPGSAADIFVDSVFKQNVDCHNPGGLVGDVMMYESEDLSPGPHTIRIDCTGGEVLVDAVEYFSGGGGDTDPPTPNPATFASSPAAISDTAISMTATTGTDASGPVEYYFDETSGNPGGSDSGWQTSASYTDTGLTGSTQYTYTVQMRDSVPNTGTASSPANATTDPTPDTDPPTPNPATFASPPSADSDTAISMTATAGSDASPPIQYYFDETSGNPGGSDSDWQTSTSYTDTGLTASTQYTYTVQMRDSIPNTGTASSPANATTDPTPDTTPPSPNPATWAAVPSAGSDTAISMTATTATDPSGVEYYFMETSANPGGSDSGWQDSASYTDTGLTGSTQYCYEVQARDKSPNQNATAWSTNECATTQATPDTTPPTPDPMTWVSVPAAGGTDNISMTATTASDPSGVQYYFDETTGGPGGTDSGWQASASYTDTGLSASTQYCYEVAARDLSVNLNETAPSSNQCATTDAPPDTTPPTPDPMTWASVPAAASSSQIDMTATTASDPSGVEYSFDETSGNPGATDSGWQSSTSYSDTGLDADTQYCYRVQARDMSVNQNATAWSTTDCATTEAGGWTQIQYDEFESGFGNWNDGGSDCSLYTSGARAHQGNNAINIQDNSTPPASTTYTNNLALAAYDQVKVDFWYYCYSMDNSNEDFWLQISTDGGSNWTTVEEWNLGDEFVNEQFYPDSVIITGFTLTNNTQLRFRCDASGNADDVYIDEVMVSASGEPVPDTDPPTPNPATWSSVPSADSSSAISMTATTGSDPSGVQYSFDETSGNPGGSDSGWQTSSSYTDSGLTESTQYTYRVQMRDQSVNQNTGSWSTSESATTQAGGGTWTKVDDTDAGWTYSGSYWSGPEPVAYMDTVHGLEGSGSASYTFTGTQVRFYATLHNFPGSAGDVYVDDIYKESIVLHNEGGLVGDVMMYESEVLSSGSHTFRIDRTGGEVLVDALEYFN